MPGEKTESRGVMRSLARRLVRFYYPRLEISGSEKIPQQGPVLLCAIRFCAHWCCEAEEHGIWNRLLGKMVCRQVEEEGGLQEGGKKTILALFRDREEVGGG